MWLTALEETLKSLLVYNSEANWQIAQSKADKESLRQHLTRMIVYLDFTKWNQVISGNVQDLIAVLLTGWEGPLQEHEKFHPNIEYVDISENSFVAPPF